MYLLKCEDVYQSAFSEVLVSQFPNFIKKESKAYFAELYLSVIDKKLIISLDKKKIIVGVPIRLDDFLNYIIEAISDHSVKFDELLYCPYQQKLHHGKKFFYLGNIHNIIIQHLLLNLHDGVEKKFLYSLAWPNDKILMINKFDTHLTNLKNLILEKLNFNISFISKSGNIKLTY